MGKERVSAARFRKELFMQYNEVDSVENTAPRFFRHELLASIGAGFQRALGALTLRRKASDRVEPVPTVPGYFTWLVAMVHGEENLAVKRSGEINKNLFRLARNR
jgi:hypothetical protein